MGVNLSVVHQALKTTALSPNEWAIVIIVIVIVLAISGAFWMKIKKRIVVK